MGYDPSGTWDWGIALSGASLMATGAIAITAALTVLSCGAAAPLMSLVIATTLAAGTLTAVNGVAEVVEAGTGYNVVRDGMFGGDAATYETHREMTATIAEVGTTVCGSYYSAKGGNVCFVAGTPVKTSSGDVPIEELSPGDLVWAWDEETGEVALKPVVETYVNETAELVHLFVNGEVIITTPTHPFYSPVKGWTEAVRLRAGDILVLVNGEYVVVEKIQHEILEAPITVYNFQVADYHTYFISNDGLLVHNSCEWKSVREASKAWNKAKKFNQVQMDIYDEIISKLASGNTSGLNIHRLTTGEFAADFHGFGKGRGQGRVIYIIVEGIIEIIDITIKHYKK